MDGSKGRDCGGGGGEVDDPLALTLGSIYAAAPAPSPVAAPTPPAIVPTLPPSPPPVVFSRLPQSSPPLVTHPPPPPPPAPLSSLSAPRSNTRRRRNNPPPSSGTPRSTRRRVESPRGDDQADQEGGAALLPAPFPWVAPGDRPTRHYALEELLLKGIMSVEGKAACKRCGAEARIAHDLEARFREVRGYVAANIHAMDDRAPDQWVFPRLPDCGACGKKGCVSPVIPGDQSEINWLFLFLGQMLGCCTLDDLKFFCKNTKNHRTGAKNRVLYYAYIEMCRQLDPQRPFNV